MSSDDSFYEKRTACRAQNNFWTVAGHDDQPIKFCPISLVSDRSKSVLDKS